MPRYSSSRSSSICRANQQGLLGSRHGVTAAAAAEAAAEASVCSHHGTKSMSLFQPTSVQNGARRAGRTSAPRQAKQTKQTAMRPPFHPPPPPPPSYYTSARFVRSFKSSRLPLPVDFASAATSFSIPSRLSATNSTCGGRAGGREGVNPGRRYCERSDGRKHQSNWSRFLLPWG